MSNLVFKNVRKVFPGDVVAVDDFSLDVPGPSMVVLVGPSGCGKTTLLRMVAGLEKPTSGSIHLDDTRLDSLAPRDRDIAMVFQSYALYPHMSVFDNLAFGLRVRKVPRAEIRERVGRVAAALEIDDLMRRRPAELSGGQRQRVALGRAIIREPRVFLFDEPLSNLDARLRGDMRVTIKKLYERLRVTSIYVTHDQVEAMTIGERLVVMNEGRIRQVGSPEECYRRPADTFVASFLGSPAMNLFEASWDREAGRLLASGVALSLDEGTASLLADYGGARVVVGVRPEHIRPSPSSGAGVTASGRVVLREPLGHETLTHLRMGDHEVIARGAEEFDGGDGVGLFVEGTHLHLFSPEDGTRVSRAAGPV